MASIFAGLNKKPPTTPLLPQAVPFAQPTPPPVEPPSNPTPPGITQPPPEGTPLPPPFQVWNTNGYAQPGFTASNFGNAPSGWDQTKWADPLHQSPKYVWGRIYQSNQNTPEGRAQMIAQLQQAYPGTTVNGDIANIPGIGPVDIFQDFGGANGISWRDINAEAAQAASDPWGGSGAGGSGSGGAGSAQSYLQQILQGGLGLPGGGFNLGPSQFDDPDTMRLLDLVRSRLDMLTTPQQDPALQGYLDRATNFANQLDTPFVNPELAQTRSVLQQILNDVQGQPFTDRQTAALLAQANDQLERDRAAATHRETARMAAMGHGRGSGTIAQSIGDINREYDNQRGLNSRAVTLAGIDQINRNRTTAANTAQSLLALMGNDQAMNEGRKAQGLGVLDTVVQALKGQRAENEARLDKALPLASIPLQLGDQRLQTALQVLGLGGAPNPTGIFNSLASLSQQTQANNILQNQQNSQFWLGLGNMIAQMPWGQIFGGQRAA